MAAAGLAPGALRLACLACLLLLAASAPPGGKRNGPVRLRENLWATGHFMGKKSVPGAARLQALPSEAARRHWIPQALGPLPPGALEGAKPLLSRDLLENFLRQRLLEEEREERDLEGQEIPPLTKLRAKDA